MASSSKVLQKKFFRDDGTWSILTWWNSWVEKVYVSAKEFEHLSTTIHVTILLYQMIFFFVKSLPWRKNILKSWFHEYSKKENMNEEQVPKKSFALLHPTIRRRRSWKKNVWVIFKRICRWHIEEQTCLSIPGKSTSVWGFSTKWSSRLLFWVQD